MRFSVRALLLLLTLIVIVVGLWSARGRWYASSLVSNRTKAAWHTVLRYNSLDPKTAHLRGLPRGVWRTSNSTNAVIWVLTRDLALTAVSTSGTIHDMGGIVCNGMPFALWTGVTPNGRSGIVLASKDSAKGSENWVMFIAYDSSSQVRLLVKIDNDKFRTSVADVNGWPVVKLATEDGTASQEFTFPESKLELPRAAQKKAPWRLVR
jgi:hypothetical protein